MGLRVSWMQYRGAGRVVFDPEQALTYSDPRSDLSPWTPGWAPPPVPADHRFETKATFSAPGDYTLRFLAGNANAELCCWTNVHVKVNVK